MFKRIAVSGAALTAAIAVLTGPAQADIPAASTLGVETRIHLSQPLGCTAPGLLLEQRRAWSVVSERWTRWHTVNIVGGADPTC